MQEPQEYYKGDGPMTALGADAKHLRDLPGDISALCEIIQGVLIHRDIAPSAYGVKPSAERYEDGNIRPLAQILTQIRKLDPRPLTIARDPNHRMPAVCRHFSLMLCGTLRAKGVPARARCGFGAYFTPGRFEDHWVCEYWNAAKSRWILVDAQLDAVQRTIFHPDFDPLDVPRDRFIIAGDAWNMCRAGRAKPDQFGLTHIKMQGMWFIASNMVRDLASLNRTEMLPWDVWGAMAADDASLADETRKLLDSVATITLAGDAAFSDVREIYESDDRLRVPPVVFNAIHNAPETIAS